MLDQATTKERRTYITPTNSEDMNPIHVRREITVIVEEKISNRHGEVDKEDRAVRRSSVESVFSQEYVDNQEETPAEHAERLADQMHPARDQQG